MGLLKEREKVLVLVPYMAEGQGKEERKEGRWKVDSIRIDETFKLRDDKGGQNVDYI